MILGVSFWQVQCSLGQDVMFLIVVGNDEVVFYFGICFIIDIIVGGWVGELFVGNGKIEQGFFGGVELVLGFLVGGGIVLG